MQTSGCLQCTTLPGNIKNKKEIQLFPQWEKGTLKNH